MTANARRYAGPIIDSHHHLWDLSLGRHPWIAQASVGALGDIRYLQQDYLIADLLKDMAGQGVTGSVHVEALWDRARDPVEETRWLEGLERPGRIAGRYIAHVPLAAGDAEAVLERHLAASPRIAGLRETIRWHPDPAKRWTDSGILSNPLWRRNLGLLRRHGLVLELLMNPYQARELAELAAAHPDQMFIVNHCGSPLDRDEAGLQRWRDGLRAMAAQPNIAIKLSNASAYAPSAAVADLRQVILPIIEAFGPGRALFGTDYPVARRTITYAAICDSLREILLPFSEAEQRAIFHDNAARLYGFSGQDQ
ncbi:amidohydrolase family protein [Teichococcus wenyumeiae]|nr:amidohydrolase family protein [Pseudoroseomonas wenyumeiae]